MWEDSGTKCGTDSVSFISVALLPITLFRPLIHFNGLAPTQGAPAKNVGSLCKTLNLVQLQLYYCHIST